MRKRILQLLIIIILVSFAINTARQVLKLNQVKRKFDQTATKLENLKAENQKLNTELQFRQTPEFVEKEARDKLGLVKEGETEVILSKGELTKEQAQKNQTGLKFWFDRLFGKTVNN